MAYVLMILTAYIVSMAYSYGLCTHGLYTYGLYTYGTYGLHSSDLYGHDLMASIFFLLAVVAPLPVAAKTT